jgi:hypothetical protein
MIIKTEFRRGPVAAHTKYLGYQTIDKLELTGQNLGQVYKFRSGCVYILFSCPVKQNGLA